MNDKFVKMSFASWEQITNHFLARIKQLVSDMLRECVQKSVANRGRTELLAQVLNTIRHFCDVVCRKDFERVLHTLDCNMGKADSYVSTKELMKNAADELRGRRESQRATEYFDTAEANGSKAIPLDKRVEQAKNRDWMQKTLGEDEYADAAKAMKFTLFYYDLCSSRVHDSIAMLLHGGFLPTIQRDIQETLLTSLNVDDVEYCARLLAGDPTLEEKRVSLFAEKEKLTQALNELEALPTMMH